MWKVISLEFVLFGKLSQGKLNCPNTIGYNSFMTISLSVRALSSACNRMSQHQSTVVSQKVNSAFPRINHYLVDDTMNFVFIYWTVIYLVDSAIQLLTTGVRNITTCSGMKIWSTWCKRSRLVARHAPLAQPWSLTLQKSLYSIFILKYGQSK